MSFNNISAKQPGGSYRISVRAAKGVDACAIARRLGGGGHTRAAGCELLGNLEIGRVKHDQFLDIHLSQLPAKLATNTTVHIPLCMMNIILFVEKRIYCRHHDRSSE